MNRKQFTVEDHLLGKDALIRSLHQRFVELVEACGAFEYVVGKGVIAFIRDCFLSGCFAIVGKNSLLATT